MGYKPGEPIRVSFTATVTANACMCPQPATWLICDVNSGRRWCPRCMGELR